MRRYSIILLLLLLAPVAGWSLLRPDRVLPARTVHRVDLTGNRFLPGRLAIAMGDAVMFVNGSGGPHNAAFWPDSLPPGARTPLAQALPDSIAPLTGPLLFEQDQTWTVTFDGIPPGRYPYYCLPHVAGGMVGEIQVGSAR